MLMLALPLAWVNHQVVMSVETAHTSPIGTVSLVVLLVVIVLGWVVRRIRPVFVFVADLFRLVMVTAVTLVVIVGAVVFALVTAVSH